MNQSVPSESSGTRPAASSVPAIWGALAIIIAAVGVAGSLLLSVGMGLRACPLCFYQRSFVMGVFAILFLGILADRSRLGLLFLVAAALSVAGLGVASFHVHLVTSGKLECPEGIYGLGDAPTQSLVLFALLTLVTLIGAFLGRNESQISVAGPVVAMLLGGAMAYGCVISSPPMPPATPPDGKPLITCRPVWTGEPANQP